MDIRTNRYYPTTPLVMAVANSHFTAPTRNPASVLELLIENGADVTTVNPEGSTALHWAARHGPDTHRSKYNSDRRTKVVAAHKAIIELLPDSGSYIDAKDKWKFTTLHCAATTGAEYMIQLLLERGPDAKLKNNAGRTALHLVAKCRPASVAAGE